MKINYYSIYHWYFQFADLRELNPIYRVALLKVNGGKWSRKSGLLSHSQIGNLILSNEVSQHFRIKNSTLQLVSRCILNGVTQESEKCNAIAFKFLGLFQVWELSDE